MGLTWIVGAVVWSAAEACFFFIVPDVLLTLAALRFGTRRALLLAILAALVAVCVGYFMWLWGAADADAARAAMLRVPAVEQGLLNRAHDDIAGVWVPSIAMGALSGVPYKLYAVEAGAAHISLAAFLIASFLARFMRFAVTILLTTAGRALAVRFGLSAWVYRFLGLGWCLVYAVYFSVYGF